MMIYNTMLTGMNSSSFATFKINSLTTNEVNFVNEADNKNIKIENSGDLVISESSGEPKVVYNIPVEMNRQISTMNFLETSTKSVGVRSMYKKENYATVGKKHVHGSGFKLKVGNENYVVTAAHNLYDIQHRPHVVGLKHQEDLPYKSTGAVDVNNNLVLGDMDTLNVNGKEIVCTSSSAGAAFWDVSTRFHFNFLKYFPKLSTIEESIPGKRVQEWNQIKANKITKFAYEQPGEWFGQQVNGDPSIHIYDLNNLRDIKQYIFQDKINSQNLGHVRLLYGVWQSRYAFTATDFTKWIEAQNGKVLFHSCHNMQICSEKNLLLVCGASNKDTFNGVMYGGVLTYDISPTKTNPFTGLLCSISPYFITCIGGNTEFKQMTANEIARKGTSQFWNADGRMKLDYSIQDSRRSKIKTNGFGYYYDQTSGAFDGLYVHDCYPYVKKNADGSVQYVHLFMSKGNTSQYGMTNNVNMPNSAKNFFNTFSHGIIDITSVSNYNQQQSFSFVSYGFPYVKTFSNNGPEDYFPHNIIVHPTQNYAYVTYEIADETAINPSGNKPSANIRGINESNIVVYDISNYNNISEETIINNYGQIKAVTQRNVGTFDTNHNFAVATVNGKQYLAAADYHDGVHVFDISVGNQPKLVGYANDLERIMEEERWYRRRRSDSMYPYQADGETQEYKGTWGAAFTSDGRLVTVNQESHAVYTLSDIGSVDLRTLPDYSKYHNMKMADEVRIYDIDSKQSYVVDVVGMDRYTDVAVLRPQIGTLSGGVETVTDAKVNSDCVCVAGNGGHVYFTKGCVVSKSSASPTMVRRVSKAKDEIITSDGHKGLVDLMHISEVSSEAVYNNKEGKYINACSMCYVNLPSIVTSCSGLKGSSGAPIFDAAGNLIAMTTYRITDGTEGVVCGVWASVVKNIAEKLISNTFQLAYFGLRLVQDPMVYDGYLVTRTDSTHDNLVAALFGKEADAYELLKINNVDVGPNRKDFTEVLVNTTVNDNVTLLLRKYTVNKDSEGLTVYTSTHQDVNISYRVKVRPTVLDRFDESPNAVNQYPNYTWFWEEKVGFYV